MTDLPIQDVLPEIRAALAAGPNLVLEAPPGAGKTTGVPLALLDEGWFAGRRILMLEPRRIAARAAARRMSEILGENVGRTVGYSMRFDRKVSAETRIEVVTEGILVRRLQTDPELADVALVIFDEFHERSLDADLGLALTLEAQGALRPDLKILVMSATLDGAAVAEILGDAPVIRSEGRAFPVETRFLPQTAGADYVAETHRVLRRALQEEAGSILVFLPGVGEIRRLVAMLDENPLPPDVLVAPLYGDLSPEEQDQAIRPAPRGKRKIVIATAIAETSLTIEGVRVVVDSGRARVPRFDPVTGMSRLETVRVSAAAAAQRRGRAGRTEPGVCYRLWTAAEDRALVPHDAPEIAAADLAPLALELAVWGCRDANDLRWLTPPPAAAFAQARDLLRDLGALDDYGAVTSHGRAMAALPLHPRIAHMVLRGREMGLGGLAAHLAALLGERDIFRGDRARQNADIRSRMEALSRGRGAPRHLLQMVERLHKGPAPAAEEITWQTGRLLALAFPDRIARRRPGAPGHFLLSNGRGAMLDQTDPLAREEFLAVAALDGAKAEGRIYLAAPLDMEGIEAAFADRISTRDAVAWDGRTRAVVAARRRMLGALVLEEKPLSPHADALKAAMIDGIRQMGLGALPWTPDLEHFRARVAFVRAQDPDGGWPDMSDAALMERLEDWLGPFLDGVSRETHLARIDLGSALRSILDWEQARRLDQLAPSHLTVPSGSRLRLDYATGAPVLAVRLQEMFGATETPAVLDGRIPVTLHLLSPAQRPVQVTQDLVGFWDRSYGDVKRDLKGRYPKHYWPDDPRVAEPTARAKPRRSA